MVNQQRVEQIFDCIDQSCMKLYEELKMPYLQSITETCNNILSGSVTEELSLEAKTTLLSAMKTIHDTTFQKEEIRKALQLAILKGFKHIKRSNEDMTPDTIGLLITFLLEKLTKGEKSMLLFDPLVGTGNLLVTVANNLDKTVVPVGVDADLESFHLAESMFDMAEYEEGLYYQDTFTFKNLIADDIVTDFPLSKSKGNTYFPFEVIKFHHQNLKEGGYFIAVIENDFFTNALAKEFHQIIESMYQVVGLIQLPETMFKQMGKSILILQKQGKNVRKLQKTLLAVIPSFQEPQAVNEAIGRMNQWFKENIELHREE
jgi:site-specific DNA-methyltransferase (adenine-specific)